MPTTMVMKKLINLIKIGFLTAENWWDLYHNMRLAKSLGIRLSWLQRTFSMTCSYNIMEHNIC